MSDHSTTFMLPSTEALLLQMPRGILQTVLVGSHFARHETPLNPAALPAGPIHTSHSPFLSLGRLCQPSPRPCFTARCRVHTEEGNAHRHRPGASKRTPHAGCGGTLPIGGLGAPGMSTCGVTSPSGGAHRVGRGRGRRDLENMCVCVRARAHVCVEPQRWSRFRLVVPMRWGRRSSCERCKAHPIKHSNTAFLHECFNRFPPFPSLPPSVPPLQMHPYLPQGPATSTCWASRCAGATQRRSG